METMPPFLLLDREFPWPWREFWTTKLGPNIYTGEGVLVLWRGYSHLMLARKMPRPLRDPQVI